MDKITNTSGALSDLLEKIDDSKVKTLDDIFYVIKNIESLKENIIRLGEEEIKKEVEDLTNRVEELKSSKEKEKDCVKKELDEKINDLKNKIGEAKERKKSILNPLKIQYFLWVLNKKEKNYEKDIQVKLDSTITKLKENKKRLDYLTKNTDEAVKERVFGELSRLDRIYKTVKNNNNLLYGAIGEVKVIKELEKLPDDYFLINNYKINLLKSIYWKEKNEWIKSVQIDHIVIGPTGIFIIETKNWSDKTMQNPSMHSPVYQVRRANHILFIILNSVVKRGEIESFKIIWGDKKISLKQIVAVKIKPVEDSFQYVEIVQWEGLRRLIINKKIEFSKKQAEDLFNFLNSQSYF